MGEWDIEKLEEIIKKDIDFENAGFDLGELYKTFGDNPFELKDCRKMKKLDVELSCCDYSDIYYSWIFKKIRKLKNPIEIRGRLGIFDV